VQLKSASPSVDGSADRRTVLTSIYVTLSIYIQERKVAEFLGSETLRYLLLNSMYVTLSIYIQKRKAAEFLGNETLGYLLQKRQLRGRTPKRCAHLHAPWRAKGSCESNGPPEHLSPKRVVPPSELRASSMQNLASGLANHR
jgi:hypothetical protein